MDQPIIQWDWVSSHLDTIWALLVEHLELSIIAVAAGFAISFVAALVAHRWRALGGPIIGVAGILYTIPSIALFAALVRITGLTIVSVEIPLTLYTLVLLVRNILIGLDSVPPDVREAAIAMGYTRSQVLWKVELPLAVPLIVAGVRIATVSTIGLVTIAAYLGFGGLGRLIADGFQTFFDTKIVLGAGLSVLLAIVANALLVGAQDFLTPWTRRRVVAPVRQA